MSPLARGLVNMELHRGDGSLGTFLGVQSGLAMKSIDLLGSDGQKQRWLPAMARLEAIGAVALTEPARGSVWARSAEDGQVKGFLVQKDTRGFEAITMEGKGAARAIWQAEIRLDGARVPESSRLPGAEHFKDAGAVRALGARRGTAARRDGCDRLDDRRARRSRLRRLSSSPSPKA